MLSITRAATAALATVAVAATGLIVAPAASAAPASPAAATAAPTVTVTGTAGLSAKRRAALVRQHKARLATKASTSTKSKTVAAGTVDATLTFAAKCAPMTLTLVQNGATLATARGSSPVKANSTVVAGTLTAKVTGQSCRTSYSLSIVNTPATTGTGTGTGGTTTGGTTTGGTTTGGTTTGGTTTGGSTPSTPPTTTEWSAGFGMFEDLQYLTGSALNARLDEYKATGVQWARFQLLWSTVQSGGPDYYYWAPVDNLIAGLVARGIRPLAVIGSTPAWARTAGCTEPTCAPADPAAFAAFAAKAAARYAAQGLHTWEVWNEPNIPLFWKPAPDPVAYTTVLRATYSAIRSVDSWRVAPGGTGGPARWYWGSAEPVLVG